MIRERAALLRQIQEFFFANLVGLYDWHDAVIGKPEPVPESMRLDYDSRNLPQVRAAFGPWEILIMSPVEKPPLGEIELRANDVNSRVYVSGAIDPATWGYIADFIKQHQHREASKWQEKPVPTLGNEWPTSTRATREV